MPTVHQHAIVVNTAREARINEHRALVAQCTDGKLYVHYLPDEPYDFTLTAERMVGYVTKAGRSVDLLDANWVPMPPAAVAEPRSESPIRIDDMPRWWT